MSQHDDHDDFGGLHRDLRAAMGRRKALRLAASLGASFGALHLLGCSGDSSTASVTDPGSGNCSKVPEETAGPYPGEGSNGPNVLNQTGVVRSDIRSSFAGLSGTADGVPLTDRAHDRVGLVMRAARQPSRLPLALRQTGTLFTLLQWRDEPELPAWDSGDRCEREGYVHVDLSGMLRGTMAAHSLRGLSEHRRGDKRREQDCYVADRTAKSDLRSRLCNLRVFAERHQPESGLARDRHGVQRRIVVGARHDQRKCGVWTDGGSDRRDMTRGRHT